MQYDAVIVGGGVGGTAIGALLAHDGWKVALFDRNQTIGGRCTCYEKDGFIVDVGVHLFGVAGQGALGEVCRRITEPDAIEWLRIQTPVLRLKGQTRRYSRTSMMESLQPEEAANLKRIFQALLEMDSREMERLWYVPLTEWLNGFSRDPQVHAFIETINAQYFAVRSCVASTAEFALSFREVVKARSSAYPKGGCIAIPRAYQRAMESRGGRTFLNTTVQRILVEHGKAAGVVLSHGSVARAPVVISNADIKDTVNHLVGPVHFPPEYVTRVNELRYAFQAVVLKVALKKKVTDDQLLLHMPYGYEAILVSADTLAGEQRLPERIGGMITSPTNYDPSLGPEGCQMIFFGAGCPPAQDWRAWERLMLNSLFEVYPEARDQLLWYRLDTPKLVEAYGGEDGNVIGVAQTVDQIHERRPSVASPLPGLYFASAEAGGHGIGTELAASSALELAAILLENEKGDSPSA